MLITIYDSSGKPKAELSPNDSSTQVKEIQGDSILTLSFTHYDHISLDVDDYVDFEGERFWLTEKYRPRQNARKEWVYDIKLYGVESMLKRLLVIKNVDDEEDPVFTLTAPPHEHVAMIVKCMNNGLGNITDWKVGQVDGTENIVIDYFGKYCDEALREIAEKVGVEAWVEGQTVNICKCEHGEPIPMGYDKGLLYIEPGTADNVKFYTRLYPVGSSRNIDREKYGYSRLQLPGGQKYVEINANKYGRVDHYEADAFADIYPRRTGIVSNVRSEVKTGEDGNPFTIYYFSDDSLPFDPNAYEIGGLVKRVSFQEGSELAGLGEEDNGTYFFEVNFNSTTREFEIITIWPYDNGIQLPGDKLIPKVGDKYILWNLRMPDEYYELAEEEFLKAVVKYNADHCLDIAVYKAPTDHVWIEDNEVMLTVGQRIRLESDEYFPGTGYRDSRITRITRKVNLPSSMDIEIGDALSRTSMQKVSDSISEVRSYAEGIAGSVALPDIIRTGDATRPTDNNLLSAKRTYADLLRRNIDERTSGKLSSDKGFEAGNYMAGVSGGMLGIDSDGDSFAEVARLYVRVKAFFEELTVVKSNVLAGKQYLTPGGGIKCVKVEETTSGYRCYFLSEQDGERTYTKFAVDDQAICEQFNVEPGTSSKVSNHRYWRLVTAVENDDHTEEGTGNHYGYIELSKSACESGSDIPKEGDEICQLGYQGSGNKERQTAMVFSTVDADAPSVKLFSGIDSFSLADKAVVSFGRDSNTSKIFFRLGNSTASQYLDYRQGDGLVVAGSISSKSTYVDDSGNEENLGSILADRITDTNVYYKQQDSSVATPPATPIVSGDTVTSWNGWEDIPPTLEDGKTMWQTTCVKKGDGSITFSTPTHIPVRNGKDGNGIDHIEEEYYLSTSSSTPTGGSWKTEANKPTWVAGKYMWTRSHVYYTDGTDETFGEVCVTGATGTSVLAEYSSDGTSWHPAYQVGDVWMRTGTDGVNWSPAVRIQGIGYSTNLIRHTKDMTGWGTDYSTNVGFSYETDTDGFMVVTQNIKTGGGNNNAYWWLWNTNNVNNQRLVESPNDVFVPGRRYTLSFEFISYPAGHPVGGYIDVRPGDDGSGRITLMSFLFSNPSGIWERVTRTFVCPQFNKNKTLSLFGLAFNANAPKDAYLKIRKICLVEGDSSEWTPAPSEMVGQDGQYRKWQWAVHTSSTSADGIAESSWKDTPLTANPGQYVWMRSGIVVPPATEPTSYDKPYTRVTGDKGDSSYMLDLTDEVKGIACDSSGNPLSASIPTSQASVFKGSEKVTSGVSYSIAQKTGITNANVTSAGVVTLSGLTADTATVVVQAVVDGVTLQSNISVYKVKPGGSYAPNLLKGTKNGILSPGASPATGAYGNCAVVFFDEGTVLSVGDKIAVKIESIKQLAGSAPNGYSIWPYSVLSNGALKSALCPNPKTVKTTDLQCTFEITSTTPEGQYPALLVYPAVNGALTGCQAQYGRIMVVRGDTPMDWSPAASEMEGAVVYQVEPSVDNITKSMTGKLSETSLKCKVYKTTGDSPRELTSDKQVRFQVIKKDGSSTISTLWPTNGETASVAVTEDTESIICELIDGSTVLDRERVPVISDASDLEIGGRNLLLRSGQGITTANYLVDKYYLSVNPIVGKTYTFTLWGQLASSKTEFGIWNSGGDVNLALLKKVADGKYQATFDWVNTAGGKTATGKHIELYALLNTQSGTSIVNRVKLEEGNVGTDWSPAPEDTGAGVNLLRNSRARLTKTYTSTGDWYNLLKKETVYLEQGKTYTISARTNCAKFTNVHGTPYENKCVLWLCSTADSTQGVVNQIVSGTDMSTDGSRGQTFVWNHPSGEYFLRINFYAAGTWWAEKVKIEKGSYATEWTPSPEDVEYMEDALKENAKIEGGLMLISTISLGQNNTDYTSQTTWSGINGIYKETATGGGIAVWFGGDMLDMADYYNWSDAEGKWIAKSSSIPSRIATGVDRFDGSGYRASGNLWWDNTGNTTFVGTIVAKGEFAGVRRNRKLTITANNYTQYIPSDGNFIYLDKTGCFLEFKYVPDYIVFLPTTAHYIGETIVIANRSSVNQQLAITGFIVSEEDYADNIFSSKSLIIEYNKVFVATCKICYNKSSNKSYIAWIYRILPLPQYWE